MGGTVVNAEGFQSLVDDLYALRIELNLYKELKWTSVSNKYLPKYKKVIDRFFEMNSRDTLHFHALIADNHKMNHAKFNKGDREVGFNKLVYQLLINKFGRNYHPEAPLHVFLDKRETTKSLEELKTILNRGMSSRWEIHNEPFESVSFIDSKESTFIQLTDVVIGAIGWHKNDHDKIKNASRAKTELAEYIAAKAGLNRLGETSSSSRFTQWNFKLRK